MQWYYVSNGGERTGPVTQEQFDQLVQSGMVTPSTLVWRAGMPAWQTWGEVSALITAGEESAVCAVSGRIYPKREMLEYQGRWVSAENKDLFFQRIREGVSSTGTVGEMRYAGFWIRFVAAFIDGLCLWVVNMVISMVFMIPMMAIGGFSGYRGGSHDAAAGGLFILIYAMQFAVQISVAIAFELFFIRKYDATPGKMAVGLKLIRADGEKLSIGRIIGRYFSKMVSALILCIGYMMAGWDDQKRALHDNMCDTRVIYK